MPVEMFWFPSIEPLRHIGAFVCKQKLGLEVKHTVSEILPLLWYHSCCKTQRKSVSRALYQASGGNSTHRNLGMTESTSLKRMSTRLIFGSAAMLLALLAGRPAHAQAAAQSATGAAAASAPAASAAAATSTAAAGVTATTDEKKSGPVTLATPVAPSGTGSSPHLIAHSGPPAEEVNRKELEDHAGRDAGKLLLRSTPAGAQIFINGAIVGHTPLLLMVAPGKYTVEMRGGRDDVAQRIVGLMANETQEISLKLSSHYPASISTK